MYVRPLACCQALALVIAASGARGAPAQWAQKNPMLAPAGQSALVAADNGLVYILGGYNTNPPDVSYTRKLQIYDSELDRWTLGANLPYFSIGDYAVEAPDGRIHLFDNLFDKILIYDPATDTWVAAHDADWIHYSARAVRTSDDRYFIFGGERPGCTTYEYFPDTFTVEPRSEMPYVPDPVYRSIRYPGAYAMPDGDVYVVGGLPHLPELYGVLDDVARYDPLSDIWLTGYAAMPTARFDFGYVRGWNGFLYAIGGSTVYTMQVPPYYDVVEYYDPLKDVWVTGPPLPEGRRECVAAIDDEGVIYVFGGAGPPDGDYVATVYALDTRVGHEGPARVDFDRDGDVDKDDLDHFEACATGPMIGPPASGCETADLDSDNDVDQVDFALFQLCFSGPDVRANPHCAN